MRIADLVRNGFRDSARRPRLILLLWLANLALAALAGAPLILALGRLLSEAPAADELRREFSLPLVADLVREAPHLPFLFRLALGSAVVIALLAGPFLAAGAMESLLGPGEDRLGARFGRGAGRFGGRFLLAGFVAGSGGLLLATLLAAPWLALGAALESTSSLANTALTLIGVACGALGFLFAQIGLDLARLEIIRQESRSPLRLLWRASLLVLRYPLRTMGIWSLNTAVVVIALALYAGLHGLLGNGSWAAILTLLAAQQAVGLVRSGTRIALWSADRSLLDGLAGRANMGTGPFGRLA